MFVGTEKSVLYSGLQIKYKCMFTELWCWQKRLINLMWFKILIQHEIVHGGVWILFIGLLYTQRGRGSDTSVIYTVRGVKQYTVFSFIVTMSHCTTWCLHHFRTYLHAARLPLHSAFPYQRTAELNHRLSMSWTRANITWRNKTLKLH